MYTGSTLKSMIGRYVPSDVKKEIQLYCTMATKCHRNKHTIFPKSDCEYPEKYTSVINADWMKGFSGFQDIL